MPDGWTDMEGNSVEVAPTNRDDIAYLTGSTDTSDGSKVMRTINFANTAHIATGGGDCKYIEFGKISGDYRMVLAMGTQLGIGFPAQTISVADPDGFPGFWSSFSGFGNIEVRATSGHSPKLSHVDTAMFTGISVPDAGTSASVESLMRTGALLKDGAGNLTVKQGAGCHSRLYCRAGTVTLNGFSDGKPAAESIPRAWLHLDATRTDTMTTFTKDGRTCISRWSDCDGGEIYASTNFPDGKLGTSTFVPYVHPPYLSPDRSPSGRQLVDFGVTDVDVSANLPSNCLLTTSEKLTGMREVFYAARCRPTSGRAASSDYRALIGVVGSSESLGYGPNNLFNTYSCAQGLRDSRHVTLNAMQVHPLGTNSDRFTTRYGKNPADFSVVSFAVADGADGLVFDLIGSDIGTRERTGGWVVGEILVYDRTLTDEERLRVNRYLMAKWQANCREDEVGELVLDTDDCAVCVPDGRTVRVKSLSTMGTKIVKTGGGTLIVDGVAPSGVPLDIRGGSIRITSPDVSETPAADPYVWLDASKPATLVPDEGNEPDGRQYITRWNDWREGATGYAELPLDEDPLGNGTKNVYLSDPYIKGHKPWQEKGVSPTKLDMVNFGSYASSASSTASFMQLVPHGTATAYCGFIVIKSNTTANQQYFGCSNTDLLQLQSKSIVHSSMNRSAAAGTWTMDGRAVDPTFNHATLYSNKDCHVVAFDCSSDKLRADLLAKYTYNQNGYAGNEMIGELLLYDRRLSAEERRNTEAYLMKKWLGQDHPESAAGFKSVATYPVDKPVVVDTDAKGVTVDVAGGNGTFVKRGAGTVTFDAPAAVSNYTALAAEGGSFTVKLDIADDAFYRYDASDLSSFTNTYLTSDGNGGLVTNILDWTDQVSGRLASSAHKNGFSEYGGFSCGTCTNPTLAYVEMPDGVARPTVNFGEYNNVAWIWGSDTKSPVPLGSFNSSSGMQLDDYGNTGKYGFKEMHAIYADRPKDNGSGLDNRAMIFTARSANPLTKKNEESLWRGSSGALFKGGYESKGVFVNESDFVSEGVVHKDGLAVPITEKLGEGFHLVSIQPTNLVNVSSISLDRNCNAGGCYVSEYVAYKEPHTPEVFAFIEAKLMRKWFGTAADRPAWFTDFELLTAKKGATLTLDTMAKVSAAELAGAGTIDAPEITDVSSLALTVPTETLATTAAVTLENGGTVSFSGDVSALPVGEYTVFTAGSIANPGAISTWTVEGNFRASRIVSLRCADGAVILKVEPKGLLLIVR